MKIVLSVNSGSSSVKVSVYEVSEHKATPQRVAEAQISGLTAPPPKLTYKRGGSGIHGEAKEVTVHKSKEMDEEVPTQAAAFDRILRELLDDQDLPQLSRKRDVAAVAHRIVHGGDAETAQHINAATLHHLEELSDLAPLHNSPSLAIVRSCMSDGSLTSATNVACFDTQFHATIPRHIQTYPIDQSVAKANGLRKYGFHGLSYAFILRSAAEFLGKKSPDDVSLIALHLGSGASACAIRNGKSHDTSMGLTPLAGLPGATRSGSVDPSLVFHYASDVGKLSPNSTKELHISRAEEILNREAGWKALTGTTDFAAIAAAKEASPKAATEGEQQPEGGKEKSEEENAQQANRILAFDLLVDRICGFVGSYYVSLGGRVDALVFAGGIGEKSALLRKAVVEQCACLGFRIDGEKNSKGPVSGGAMSDVTAADAEGKFCGGGGDGGIPQPKVLICQTDEQFEMARWCSEDESLWRS